MSEEITRQLPDDILQTILNEVRAMNVHISDIEARLQKVEADAKDSRRAFNQNIVHFGYLTEDLREGVEKHLDNLDGRDAA